MKWITRSHVHVDRVACPWLITRFVDSEAEFLFVPKSRVDEVAAETGAIPFDSTGVELGHHEGRTERGLDRVAALATVGVTLVAFALALWNGFLR